MPELVAIATAVGADLKAERREFLFRLPQWAERKLKSLLNDPRDLPVALLLSNIAFTVLPAAFLVIFLRSHLLGLVYVTANYTLYLQRFLVALLHVTEHRRLFKKEARGLNALVPIFLAPLYGLPSGMYKLHHKLMHHVEGNRTPLDNSSTELYQRDSLAHFIRYWGWHTFGAWISVPLYAYKKGRPDLLLECLAGESGYLILVAFACWRSLVAAFWLLILPFALTSLAIMFGNWSQHIFVDTKEPQNVYRSTYNCVNCPDNQITFNDGYHILHHLNSKSHWSELPQRLLDAAEQHAAQKAFVFEGIGFFDVGLLVMTGRLDVLADHLVPCCQQQAELSKSEVIELMKSRLKPLPPSECLDSYREKT